MPFEQLQSAPFSNGKKSDRLPKKFKKRPPGTDSKRLTDKINDAYHIVSSTASGERAGQQPENQRGDLRQGWKITSTGSFDNLSAWNDGDG